MKQRGSVAVAQRSRVAPLAGAWIETNGRYRGITQVVSPPSRGRGLKLGPIVLVDEVKNVAPFAGAWIETEMRMCCSILSKGRPLRGGVD